MKRAVGISSRHFATRQEWRAWLKKNHAHSQGMWVVLYKQHVGKGMQYPAAVEEALSFGWIDGQLRRIDDRKHMLRFTPRRPGGIWAPSNIARVKKLIKEKKMTPAGLKVFTPPKHPERVAPVVTTPKSLIIPTDLKRALKAKPMAWKHWLTRPPSHRRQVIWWIVSAKQRETRIRRINNAVSNLARYARPHW